jgi:hypothetical protein
LEEEELESEERVEHVQPVPMKEKARVSEVVQSQTGSERDDQIAVTDCDER